MIAHNPLPNKVTNYSTLPDKGRPVLLIEIAHEIKAVGCRPWLVQKLEAAFILRFECGPKQFRLALAPVNGDPISLPEERTPTHIIEDLPGLRQWLDSQARQ